VTGERRAPHPFLPGNNWGKIYYYSSSDAITSQDATIDYVLLNFYFFWQNRTDNELFLYPTTELSPLGVLEGNASPGLFGGEGGISLYGSINSYVGDLEGGGFATQMPGVDARSHGLWGLGGTGSDHATTTLEGQPYSISGFNIEVGPDQIAVFEVSMLAIVEAWNGNASLDFKSRDYSVVCPGVNLEVCFLLGPLTLRD
jgi:hypothetical protein